MIRFMRLEEPEVSAEVNVDINMSADPVENAPEKKSKLNIRLLWKYTKAASVPVMMLIVIVLCLRNSAPESATEAAGAHVRSRRDINYAEMIYGKQNNSARKNFDSDQLYLFGGQDYEGFISSASHYNSSSGQWRSTTSMNEPKAHFCGVSISSSCGGKILLFGGAHRRTGGGRGGQRLKTAEVFDIETETYTQLTSLPSGRASCGAAELDGYIYIAGGYDGYNPMSSVVRYNFRTGQVEPVNCMNSARNSLQLVELGGYLYAVGGWSQDTAERFNPKTGTWSNIASPRYEHYDFGAAAHQGKIYICSHAGFEVYNPETDRWTTLPNPRVDVGKTLVSMNGELWAVGSGSIYTFDINSGRWNYEQSMDSYRRYHTAFVVSH